MILLRKSIKKLRKLVFNDNFLHRHILMSIIILIKRIEPIQIVQGHALFIICNEFIKDGINYF